jgi:hypothetical protein
MRQNTKTALEIEAQRLTREFLTYVRNKFGKPINQRLLSASFNNWYNHGLEIDGWHGQPSRKYGNLNVVLTIYVDHTEQITWHHAFSPKFNLENFREEDLADYRKFLVGARKIIDATPTNL